MTAESQRKRIELDRIIAALEQPLVLIENPERRAEIERYIALARAQLERAVFALLSEVVVAIDAPGGDKRARLVYEDGALHLVVEPVEPREPEGSEPSFGEGHPEKVTIRIAKELKDLIDRASSFQGLSANRWYIRELSRVAARYAREQVMDQFAGKRRGNRGRWGSLKGFVGRQ